VSAKVKDTTTTLPVTDAAPAKPLPAHFDASVRMVVTLCGECGMAFAVPAIFYSDRVKARGSVRCPDGHVNPLVAPDRSDLVNVNRILLRELMQSRRETDAARDVLARAAIIPAAPAARPAISKKELKRRVNLLASRAESGPFLPGIPGRICIVCGKTKGPNALPAHLKRSHFDAVAAMPGEAFA
jgi:hypothetical protein